MTETASSGTTDTTDTHVRIMAGGDALTVSDVRARASAVNAARLAAMRADLMPAEEIDGLIPGPSAAIPIRILRPAEPVAGRDDVGGGPSGLTIVYFHGGGWIVGDLATHLGQARRLCVFSGATVVTVDYRIAPEHRFPGAYADAIDATTWIAEHLSDFGGPGALVVAGDGTGGQLAASVAIGARDAGLPLAAQLLLHPVTDVAGCYRDPDINASYMSRWDSKKRSTLTLEALGQFATLYVDEADSADWRVSPKRATDLHGVAPAVIHTSTLDVLRTEGNFYADDLRAADVPVISREFPSSNHSYFATGEVSAVSDAAAAEAIEDMRSLMAGAASA